MGWDERRGHAGGVARRESAWAVAEVAGRTCNGWREDGSPARDGNNACSSQGNSPYIFSYA